MPCLIYTTDLVAFFLFCSLSECDLDQVVSAKTVGGGRDVFTEQEQLKALKKTLKMISL